MSIKTQLFGVDRIEIGPSQHREPGDSPSYCVRVITIFFENGGRYTIEAFATNELPVEESSE